MAINLGTGAPATAACNAIRTMVDSAGVGTGFLQLLSAATIGCIIPFSAGVSAFTPAVLSAASGTTSCAVPISATCQIAQCTFSSFRVCQANSAVIWSGTCGSAAGADLVFSNLVAASGDNIVITAMNFIVGGTAA